MIDAWEEVRLFLTTGGPILWVIGGVSTLLATLIVQRYWFFRHDFKHWMDSHTEMWRSRRDRGSWMALAIRASFIAESAAILERNLALIRVLVTLCPLLGLLGTVTGMMTVFEVIAMLGTGNPRAMASGIAQATLPTMAGMTIMIPGLYFRHELQREKERLVERFANRLTL